jgi:hypothetical protein
MLQGMPSESFRLAAHPSRFTLPAIPLELAHLSSSALKPTLA